MQGLVDSIRNIGNSIVSVFDYIITLFKFLRYGLTSLLTGIWDLIVYVFTGGGVFELLPDGFSNLALFIGYPAVAYISSLLLFIIFRIGISFVFKIFRLNMDYKTMKTKRK